VTHFIGECGFFEKIREKQLQPSRFTQHLQGIIKEIKGIRRNRKVKVVKQMEEASTWVPLLLGETVGITVSKGESQLVNYLDLSVKASSDAGVKQKDGRKKAVTDLLQYQRRLARYLAKAMGHRNGHLWKEYPAGRSSQFEDRAKRRALKKRARRAARDKHLKSPVAGRKQLKERRRLELQRSGSRRRTLRRWAKKQSNRLSYQARQHLEE